MQTVQPAAPSNARRKDASASIDREDGPALMLPVPWPQVMQRAMFGVRTDEHS